MSNDNLQFIVLNYYVVQTFNHTEIFPFLFFSVNMNNLNIPQSSSKFISDLGVDTTKLPKPQLPKNLKKDNDSNKNIEKDIS